MTGGVGRGGVGEGSQGRGTCLFRERSHIAVWQKQTQLCKAVVLQLKKRETEEERCLGLEKRTLT